MTIRRRRRRGVVLLICLSILVLFMLIGVTFLIVSGQYLSGAKIMARHNIVGDDPQKETETAFMQALVGTRTALPARSAIRGHEILRDLYGVDSVSGVVSNSVANPSLEMGGQFIRIPFGGGLNQRPGYYNGRVFTMLNGPAAGISTRVVDYSPTSNPPSFLVEMLESDNPDLVSNINNAGMIASVFVNFRFLVNGGAFNGTGFGYVTYDSANPTTTGSLDQMATVGGTSLPVALLPHFATYLTGIPETGGADETYDADDFQNMFLAKNIPSPLDIDPSFHRRALVRYWDNYFTTNMGSPPPNDVIRSFVLRPMPFDHPNFTGSNPDPRFASSGTVPNLLQALVSGPWDVDNDGDGVADSIWLDLDLPVKTMPDGRRYKPLVAFLIQDLDGRLNVNAHSSVAHADATYTNQVFGGWASGMPFQAPRNIQLPRGLGYGPVDIAFGHVMASPAEFSSVLNGRYGNDGGTPRPGVTGTNDGLSAVKSSNIPPIYNGATISAFASPPDVWGRGAMALDYAGQPYYPLMNPTLPYTHVSDDPYELNLSQSGSQDTGAWDAPYTVAEMERLLRLYDVDSPTLPSRLAATAPTTFNTPISRRLLTTHGSQIPVPNVTLPLADRTTTSTPHYTDLFAAKLAAGGLTTAQINYQLQVMLPTEMYRGQRFNVNRPLGNGRDDNGNNVADEPLERDTGEFIWATGTVPTQFNNIAFNYLNNDPIITVNRYAPQIYARHLYCLMMLLNDQGYSLPFLEGGLNINQTRELTAQRIAQWAINVVDFRDPDAIMTPFEYDINPFDGWQTMDGDPGTNEVTTGTNAQRRLVWGAEFPDLMITETKSFHDRRVRDTNMDADMKRRNTGMTPDSDLDQFRIPQGSVFIELYCPRNFPSNNPLLPRELYRAADNRLNLAQLANFPSADGVRHPVWRLAISANHIETDNRSPFQRARATNPSTTSFDPDKMSLLLADNTTLPIERYVWFTNQSPAGTAIANRVFRNSLGWDASLAPGQYAVVGPRATTIFGSITDGDDMTTPYDGPAQQRITLQNWTANPTGVLAQNVAGASTMPTLGSQIQPAVGIVADMDKPAGWMNAAHPRVGLNVTEPLPLVASTGTYYPEPNSAGDARVPSDAYDDPDAPTNTIIDEPLDAAAGMPLQVHSMLGTATYHNRNTIFLQRLANPMEAWDPLRNPYISIDWAALDTTVFSGEEDTTRMVSGGADDGQPLDPSDPQPAAARQIRVRTRERGEQQPFGTATGNIWSPYAPVMPMPVTAALGTAAPNPYFDYNLTHTYSYLNVAASAAGRLSAPPAPAGYAGAPANPFPHLNWLDRPFASPLELMQVPASTPGRLMWEFSNAIDAPGADPYDQNGGNATAASSPFGHLLNFTQGSRRPTPATFTAMTAPVPGAFHRLFDLVETPSPFVGTERWYNPTQFSTAAAGTSADGFRPPYNRLSRFRQPGQINLNTIFDQQVFEGLMKGYFPYDPSVDAGAFWSKFSLSRQGYEGSLPNTFPAEFANPFRSANSADLAPPSTFAPKMRRDGVEATLLRSELDAATGTYMPLFAYKPALASEVAYANSRMDSHARYHPLQRLPNLVSTHSNVFAIWITVGYFELEAITPDAVHPDGYRLGQEIGLDTGTVKRHRAFYIFDRSIPVAFEPGENHNVDRAVLLKRFIE